ncbi:hypothetical protein [Streptomyces sp. NPDC001652]
MTKYRLLTLVPFLGGPVPTAYEAWVPLTEHVLRRVGRRAMRT